MVLVMPSWNRLGAIQFDATGKYVYGVGTQIYKWDWRTGGLIDAWGEGERPSLCTFAISENDKLLAKISYREINVVEVEQPSKE